MKGASLRGAFHHTGIKYNFEKGPSYLNLITDRVTKNEPVAQQINKCLDRFLIDVWPMSHR